LIHFYKSKITLFVKKLQIFLYTVFSNKATNT